MTYPHSLIAKEGWPFIAISLSLISAAGFAAPPCQSDFASFLSKFETEKDFQRQNTRFPLEASYVDGSASPEPGTITYKIGSPADPNYSRASFPGREEQAAVPFERKVIAKQGVGHMVVQFTKPDTDYQFAFTFEKSNSCWRLVKFDDHSLTFN